MKKVDSILIALWSMVVPSILALFVVWVALYEFDAVNFPLEDDQAVALLNAAVLLALVFVAGWAVNLTWGLIRAVREKLRLRYLDEHPEKCVTKEQIAQDLEDLAKALREENK